MFQSQPTSFKADQTTSSPVGPTPGSLVITTSGVAVALTELKAFGGMCVMTNTDNTNYVTYGIKAGATFYPLGELLPSEIAVLRLSRDVLYGEVGTAVTQSLWLVANTASCVVKVEAFDP